MPRSKLIYKVKVWLIGYVLLLDSTFKIFSVWHLIFFNDGHATFHFRTFLDENFTLSHSVQLLELWSCGAQQKHIFFLHAQLSKPRCYLMVKRSHVEKIKKYMKNLQMDLLIDRESCLKLRRWNFHSRWHSVDPIFCSKIPFLK